MMRKPTRYDPRRTSGVVGRVQAPEGDNSVQHSVSLRPRRHRRREQAAAGCQGRGAQNGGGRIRDLTDEILAASGVDRTLEIVEAAIAECEGEPNDRFDD